MKEKDTAQIKVINEYHWMERYKNLQHDSIDKINLKIMHKNEMKSEFHDV